MRKDTGKLHKKFSSMDDHDVLVEVAVTQKVLESHLRSLNGSVESNLKNIQNNKEEITSIKAAFGERTKSCPALTGTSDERRFRRLMVAAIVIASISGMLGAHSETFARILGV